MKLRWSPDSKADRREIFDRIAADDREAARRWDAQIRARAQAAARVPNSGHRPREVRDDSRYANVLEVLLRTYRIIYSIEAGTVFVLRVWEGHRLLLPEDLGLRPLGL